MKAMVIGLVGLIGCSGSDGEPAPGGGDVGPLDRVYEVASHTKNAQECGVEGETLRDDPWFRLAENNQGGLDYYTCRGESDCDGEPDVYRSFSDSDDGQWMGVEAWSALDASDDEGCRIYKRVHLATVDDTQAQIERWTCRTNNSGIDSQADCEALVDVDMECSWDGPRCHDYELVIATAP